MTSIKVKDLSRVYWYPEVEDHACGYCRNARGSIIHGMWAKSLTADDYQNLIDRGWRRSGHYCYKPLLDQTCCPLYTIRCDALNFQFTKSQKKVAKKFNKFINDGILPKSDKSSVSSENDGEFVDDTTQFLYRHPHSDPMKEAQSPTKNLENNHCDKPPDDGESSKNDEVREEKDQDESPSNGDSSNTTSSSQANKKVPPKSGCGADPTRPPCKKAKLLRLERKQQKLQERGMSLEQSPVKNESKSLEDFLEGISKESKHKLRRQLVIPSRRGADWERILPLEIALFRRYQGAVHGDPPTRATVESFSKFLIDTPLKMSLERLDETHEHFKLVAHLFAKYQMFVHNEPPDECGESQFLNFLVESPLKYVRFSNSSIIGFGSFHQLYWLDDKLIAVSVIDILPKCVSAVYFFYDPDYRNLTLGTYSCLREVQLARSLHQQVPSIKHYYMGYYIHSCPKMRYKGKYAPSYLLCPETYRWVPFETSVVKLDAAKYSRFLDDENVTDDNACSETDVNQILIGHERGIMRYQTYKRIDKSREEMFKAMGRMVGKKCIKNLLFTHVDF